MKIIRRSLASLLFLICLLTACTPRAASQPDVPGAIPSPSPALLALPSVEPTPVPTTLPLPTVQVGCTDSALYVADVSIPDNTNIKAGEAFTKTWRLRNTGKCIWNQRYALVYVGGEQMGAVVTTPLSETVPGETLDISINLTAPTRDGYYTGLYELRNPQGRALQIALVTSIWVKITVGNVSPVSVSAPVQPGVAATAPTSSAPCRPEQNAGYVEQIFSLINAARAVDKLPALTNSAQLAAAAQGHSDDMACNNFAGHTGSDGSSIHDRVVVAGYAPSYSEEVVFPGGGAQDAVNWWLNDKTHRDALLNPKVTEIGVGYAYLPGTAYGSYITVDFAAP